LDPSLRFLLKKESLAKKTCISKSIYPKKQNPAKKTELGLH